MSIQLQALLISVSIIVFLVILRNIKKSRLGTDIATIWILWGLGLIVISLFPRVVFKLSSFVGIIAPINSIFLMMIFLLYMLVFYLYMRMSMLEEKVKNLIHEVALMNKKENEHD